MNLVFLGTPPFAVPTLRLLAAGPHRVAGVVTNPDRPRGRGRRSAPPAVKVAAAELGLEVAQPDSPRDPDLADHLASWSPDLFVVVAFSILPRRLLRVPRLGSVNLHPSLLPAYRGAAPIPWAVIRGEEQTGLTTFLLNDRVDGGDLLLQQPVAIGVEETAGELEQRLAILGAELVRRTVDGLAAGSLQATPQAAGQESRAPKLSREDGLLDWSQPAEVVRNRIRGTNPVPGAFTHWAGGELKVLRARLEPGSLSAPPGTVMAADPRRGLVVAAAGGALLLTEVQPAGRRPMEGSALVRGYGIEPGARLGQDPGSTHGCVPRSGP